MTAVYAEDQTVHRGHFPEDLAAQGQRLLRDLTAHFMELGLNNDQARRSAATQALGIIADTTGDLPAVPAGEVTTEESFDRYGSTYDYAERAAKHRSVWQTVVEEFFNAGPDAREAREDKDLAERLERIEERRLARLTKANQHAITLGRLAGKLALSPATQAKIETRHLARGERRANRLALAKLRARLEKPLTDRQQDEVEGRIYRLQKETQKLGK